MTVAAAPWLETAVLDQANTAKQLMEPMVRKVGSSDVVEQAAIAGALNPQAASDPAVAQAIAGRLDALAPEPERGWTGVADQDGGLGFKRRLRGITESHTIDATGFVIETPTGALGYSGDTGPTQRFWEKLNERQDLRALLMEISFPDEHHKLAQVSGHHTPESLEKELHKLHDHRELPVLLYHIKPVFEQIVEKELARIRDRNLDICRLGDQFIL